jgi:hypothetical protein
MECETRERLIADYRQALSAINEAARAAGASDSGTERWKTATLKARIGAKAAILSLNEHREEHGC